MKVNLLLEDGYSLITVMIICQLLIILVISFITFALITDMSNAKSVGKKRLDLLCISAVEMDKLHYLKYPKESYSIEIDSTDILVEKRLKGLYVETTATVKNSTDSSKLRAVFGNSTVPQFVNALTLSEPKARLAVTGTTSIIGDISFTGKKVVKGKISGIENSSANYHEGSLYTNVSLDTKIYNDSLFIMLFSNKKEGFDTTINKLEFTFSEKNLKHLIGKKVFISGNLSIEGEIFSDYKAAGTTLVVGGKLIIKSQVESTLNLELYCDSSATVAENANIQNCIIISKSGINIQKNCLFTNTQLISKKNITIQKSQFNYPADIAVYIDVSQKELLNTSIQLNSSIINGSILLLCSTIGTNDNKSKIELNNSIVHGTVYSENYAEVTGKIIGSLYTYRLRYYKKPTEYINWMVNLNIDRSSRDNSFLYPIGFKEAGNYEILEETWIY
jgi:hypothetical protein